MCALVGLLFLLMCAGLAIDALRAQVRADEQGLRWREDMRGWKSARWDEITDFYCIGWQSGTPVIETPQGKLWLSDRFLGIGALVELVPQRAATATARQWEVRGYRSGEAWETTLSVWSKSQVWTAPLLTLAALYVVGFGGFAIIAGPRDIGGSRNATAPLNLQWFDAVGLVIALLVLGSFCSMMIVPTVLAWRERKFAHAHRDETLTLNARGIRFASATQRVEAAWSEVQRVEPCAKERGGYASYRVITDNGDFTLWSLSSNKIFVRFRSRCESYAPDALKFLEARDAALTFDAEINPAPPAADGTQTFSFRTRGNRLLLICVNTVVMCAPLFYLFSNYMRAGDESFAQAWLLFGVLCVFAILISLLLYLWFARACIVAAEDLQLHSPFRRTRHICRDEIEALDEDIWGRYVRVDGRKIYWMRGLSPARVAELNKIIGIHWLLQT